MNEIRPWDCIFCRVFCKIRGSGNGVVGIQVFLDAALCILVNSYESFD
jgi:hypothetical protein